MENAASVRYLVIANEEKKHIIFSKIFFKVLPFFLTHIYYHKH